MKHLILIYARTKACFIALVVANYSYQIKRHKRKTTGICLGTLDCDICPAKSRLACAKQSVHEAKIKALQARIDLL
jgi:hypothetical protein